MNNCCFVGKLANEPELREVNSTFVVNFCLAVEDYRKDKNGEKHRQVIKGGLRQKRRPA